MKEFVKYILVLLISFFLLNITLSGLIDRTLKYSNIRFTRMVSDDYDMAVMGNSRAVNSMSEDLFEKKLGLNVINLGYNGLTKGEMFFLATHLRDSTVLFLECSGLLWGKSSVFDYDNKFRSFEHLRDSSFDPLSLANYNNELFLRSLYYLTGNDRNWINNGQLSNDKLNFLKEGLSSRSLFYDAIDFQNFDSLFALRNIEAYYFIAPIRPEMKEAYLNWNEIMLELHKRYPDNFYDLSNLIYRRESFADLIHTNRNELDLIHDSLFSIYSKSK